MPPDRLSSRLALAQAYMDLLTLIPGNGSPVADPLAFGAAIRHVHRQLDVVALAYGAQEQERPDASANKSDALTI